eukprot:gene26065-11768_t
MKAPGGPKNQVWDGRMLDAQESIMSKKDDAHAPAVVKGNPQKVST